MEIAIMSLISAFISFVLTGDVFTTLGTLIGGLFLAAFAG